FLAARTLYLLATSTTLPARLPPEELGLLVGGVVWQFVPDYVHPNLPQAQLAQAAQRIGKLLARKQRDAVMPFALECSGELDFSTIGPAVRQVANRVGLLLCGNLGAAVAILGRLGGLPDPLPRGVALLGSARGNADIEELVGFLASDELGEIRR